MSIPFHILEEFINNSKLFKENVLHGQNEYLDAFAYILATNPSNLISTEDFLILIESKLIETGNEPTESVYTILRCLIESGNEKQVLGQYCSNFVLKYLSLESQVPTADIILHILNVMFQGFHKAQCLEYLVTSSLEDSLCTCLHHSVDSVRHHCLVAICFLLEHTECKDLLEKVINTIKFSSNELRNPSHLPVLCYVIDFVLKYDSGQLSSLPLWTFLNNQLQINDFIVSKQVIYIFKKITTFLLNNKMEIVVADDFKWSIEKSADTANDWYKLFTIIESLNGKQSHLIMPSLEMLPNINLVPKVWLDIVLKMILNHTNKQVLKFGIHFLNDSLFFWTRITDDCMDLIFHSLNHTFLFDNYNLHWHYLLNIFKQHNSLKAMSCVDWNSVPLWHVMDALLRFVEMNPEFELEDVDAFRELSTKVCRLQNTFVRGCVQKKMFEIIAKQNKFSCSQKLSLISSFEMNFDEFLIHVVSKCDKSFSPELFTAKNLIEICGTHSISLKLKQLFINLGCQQNLILPEDFGLICNDYPNLKLLLLKDNPFYFLPILDELKKSCSLMIEQISDGKVPYSPMELKELAFYMSNYYSNSKKIEIDLMILNQCNEMKGNEMLFFRMNYLLVNLIANGWHPENSVTLLAAFDDSVLFRKNSDNLNKKEVYNIFLEAVSKLVDHNVVVCYFTHHIQFMDANEMKNMFAALKLIPLNTVIELDALMDACISGIVALKKQNTFLELCLEFLQTFWCPISIVVESQDGDGLMSARNKVVTTKFVTALKDEENTPGLFGLIVMALHGAGCNENIDVFEKGLIFGQIHKGDQRIENELVQGIKATCPHTDFDYVGRINLHTRKFNICLLSYGFSATFYKSFSESHYVRLISLTQIMCQQHKSGLNRIKGALLDQSISLLKDKPRYYSDSLQHRLKLRILQALYFIFQFNNEFDDRLLIGILNENNQPNVACLYEIIIAETIPREKLVALLDEPDKLTNNALQSIFVIMYLRCTRDLSCIPILVTKASPWICGQNFATRLFAQVVVLKAIKLLTSTPPQYLMLLNAIEGSLKLGNANRHANHLLKDFRLHELNIDETLSMCDIYHYIPKITDMASDEIFPKAFLTKIVENEGVNQLNENSSIWMAQNFKIKHDPVDVCLDIENIQRKMTPLKELFPNVHDLVTTAPSSAKGDLIIIATLISKIPNLGGLSRTCEIFGVKSLVIDSLKHIESRDFQSLSMTSEKWVHIIEMKDWQLVDYLLGLKTNGYCIVGAEQTSQSKSLKHLNFPLKTAILLGHEKEGIPANLIALLDIPVEIPQLGVVRSLNVHVTGSIFIWEYAKQHQL